MVGDFCFFLSCCIGLCTGRTMYILVSRVKTVKTTQSSKIRWSGVTNTRIKFAHANFSWVIIIYQMLHASATWFLLFIQIIPDSDHRSRLGWPKSFFSHLGTKSGPRHFGLYSYYPLSFFMILSTILLVPLMTINLISSPTCEAGDYYL